MRKIGRIRLSLICPLNAYHLLSYSAVCTMTGFFTFFGRLLPFWSLVDIVQAYITMDIDTVHFCTDGYFGPAFASAPKRRTYINVRNLLLVCSRRIRHRACL